jgi:hypothetical protein
LLPQLLLLRLPVPAQSLEKKKKKLRRKRISGSEMEEEEEEEEKKESAQFLRFFVSHWNEFSFLLFLGQEHLVS